MKDILWQMVVIQTIAQTLLYLPAGWVLKVFIQFFVNFFGMETREKINKIIFIGCLVLNILVTLVARYLTSQGAIAGTANLGASCVLSLVMWWTFRERGIYGIKKWVK